MTRRTAAVHGALLGACIAAGACGTEPSPPALQGRYQLSIDASPACAGALPVSSFSWVVETVSGSPSAGTMTLPSAPDPNGLDDLRLRLSLTAADVAGGLEGGARTDRSLDGGYTARFYDAGRTPAPVRGVVRTTGAARIAAADGTFAGTINVGLYRSSAGGSCAATDHAWALAAR